ncbi:MAG: PAC2 family protein [Planctomycetota bacterium]|nr:PAC2 family protein [Planctomycetota bacterium]
MSNESINMGFGQSDSSDLWLVVGWPGVGGVAAATVQAIHHELGSSLVDAIEPDPTFEVEDIRVRSGVCFPGPLPRLSFRAVTTGVGQDLLLFVPDRQPDLQGLSLCRRVLRAAYSMGVRRVITFAALTTTIAPEAEPEVFFCSPDPPLQDELRSHGITPMQSGSIRGLNGLMLLAAQEMGIPSACLISEIPTWGMQMPNPKTAKALSGKLAKLVGLKFRMAHLDPQIEAIEECMVEMRGAADHRLQGMFETDLFEREKKQQTGSTSQSQLSTNDMERLESLFTEASLDRSRTMALKVELDRLGVFDNYEDRFLDLFRECS